MRLHAAHMIRTGSTMSSEAPAGASPISPPVAAVVRSFDGTEIHYDLYDAPSSSAVLVVPGFWRDRRHPAMVRLAHSLVARGHRTVVLDVRGHGESGGTYGFNLHEHHDVAAVADDILSQKGVSSLLLIGFSYGGAIAISAMARHDLPISGALLVSPVADFAMISPRLNPFKLHRHIALSQAMKRPRFAWGLRRLARIRALDDVPAVHVPLCFIHVKNDWLVDHAHSVALYEAANEPKELHILDIEGNYHADRIFNVASDFVEPLVTAFLERHARLRPE